MDYSSCGFDHARSRPGKIIKGAKKELPEDMELVVELGAAPCVALFSAGRFVVSRGIHGGAAEQGRRRLRRG
jgi:hypothetical protein